MVGNKNNQQVIKAKLDALGIRGPNRELILAQPKRYQKAQLCYKQRQSILGEEAKTTSGAMFFDTFKNLEHYQDKIITRQKAEQQRLQNLEARRRKGPTEDRSLELAGVEWAKGLSAGAREDWTQAVRQNWSNPPADYLWDIIANPDLARPAHRVCTVRRGKLKVAS